MDSTHRELYFLLLLASQLSKRSSGGLGEVKNCRWESQNCASRDLSRRRNSNRPPETVAGTHRNTKSGRHPSHSRSVTPPTHQHLQKLPGPMNVNNGGDESFVACSSIGSVWTKLFFGWTPQNLQFYLFEL